MPIKPKPIKVNFKMPTPSAADRMYAKHQIIRKAAGLPDVDNNPDRPNAGKYSSGDSKPVKRVNPVATPSVNEEDITVVKKGSNIKKKISDASYNVFKSHGFVKEEEQLDELSPATKASYVTKAKDQIKQSMPFTKKSDEYRDIAKNFIEKRKKGIAKANEEVVVEMDNRTSRDDSIERRKYSPEGMARQDKEQQKRLKDTSAEMRKKLRLPEPKKVEEAVTLGGMVGRGNIYQYDRNPGPRDGSELENVPFNAKTEKQKKLKTALTDLGNKMKEKYPKLREEKDSQEYDYEGDMAKSDLRSIIHNAKTLHDMLDDDTNLAEWCQSKITLAEDYISTVTNYMRSEMNEEVEQLQEYESKGGSYTHKGSYGSQNTGSDSSKYAKPHTAGGSELKNSTTVGLEKGMGVKWGRKSLGIAQSKQTLMNVHKNLPEEIELDEKKKLPGLWANIHAKRKRGEAPAKPGDKDYPKTLNIEDANPCWTGYKRKPGTKKFEPGSCVKEGVQDDPKADQMTTDDTKFPKKSRKAAIVKSAAKKMPAEDQFQAKPRFNLKEESISFDELEDMRQSELQSKSRKSQVVKTVEKKMPAEDQFQAKPVLDSQVAQQTNK